MSFRTSFRKALREAPAAQASVEEVYIFRTATSDTIEVELEGYLFVIRIAILSRPLPSDVTIYDGEGDVVTWMKAVPAVAAEEVGLYINEELDSEERSRALAEDDEILHAHLNKLFM